MEHNAYGVWHVKVRHMEMQFTEEEAPKYDRVRIADKEVVRDLTILAPAGNLGLQLLTVMLDRKFATSPFFAGSTDRWRYLTTPEQEKIDVVIRYDDEYRGRM